MARQMNPVSSLFSRPWLQRIGKASLAGIGLLCLLTSNVMAQGKTVIKVSGQIYDGKGGPFQNNKVYWITGASASIPAGKTLSVGPGATVKLNPGMVVTVIGTLNSNGASWTSIYDDTIGGDSNADGGLTKPAPGDWAGITFGGGSEKSVVHSNLFRFGGRKGHTATLWVRSAKSVTITKNLIDLSGSMGINWDWSKSIIKDNSILRCKDVPMQGVAIGVAGISNNIAKYNTPGNYVRIWHHNNSWTSGTLTLSPDQTTNKSGVFVVARSSTITPPTGGRLTIPAGMILKFEPLAGLATRTSTIYLNGTRTNPVHLTSIADDSVGGDTNNDGNKTTPKPGDWKNIALFQKGKSIWNHVHMRYGGFGGIPLVKITWGASARMIGCWLQASAGDGISNAPYLGTLLELTDCIFNNLAGIPVTGIDPESLTLASGNQATNNQGGNHMALRPVDVSKNLTIGPEHYTGSVLLSLGTIRTIQGGTLTLRPGTRIKFAKGQGIFFRYGSMQLVGTAQRPIILTSFHDDSIGGDTNRSTQAPSPGDWNGIDLRSSAGSSSFQHILIRYPRIGVACSSARATVRSVRCDYPSSVGINIQYLQGALENAVVYASSGSGIVAANRALEIRHATVTMCKLGGINLGSQFPGNIRNSISWGNTTLNFGTVLASRIWNSNGASAGKQGNINSDPKFMNVAKGDLRLAANSPCLNRADTQVAILTASDFFENSRIIDHGLSGSSLPDMGAYERAVWFTVASGPAYLGRTINFKTTGAHVSPSPAGVNIYFLGGMDISFQWANFGMELVGLAGLTVMGTSGMDSNLAIPIPNNNSLQGITIGIQPLCLSTGILGRGHFGTLYRSTLRSPQ